MTRTFRPSLALLLAGVLAGCGGGGDPVAPTDAAAPGMGNPPTSDAQDALVDDGSTHDVAALAAAATTATLADPATRFVVDFIATAADGVDINAGGTAIGRAYTDCTDGTFGPFCLPPARIFVWCKGQRTALPLLPGLPDSYHRPLFINGAGLIAGVASTAGVVLWKPDGNCGYTVEKLGFFPGKTSSSVAGLDEQGRLVGWATEGGSIPTATLAFMWSAAGGMVDLTARGYPNEPPLAMSPGGRVVTTASSYQLDNLASIKRMAPPPSGFMGPGYNGSVINDAGDQAHFLVTTSSQSLVYPFRLVGGTWQQISQTATGSYAHFGMGTIDASGSVSFTASSTGMLAVGPAGLGAPLAARLSSAYGGAAITDAGRMNANGEIVAQAVIGRSARLVKLTPATPCTSNCMVAGELAMTSQLASTTCTSTTRTTNPVVARVTVRSDSEAGAPLAGAVVRGRFLDDYWADQPVTATTNSAGVATFDYQAACGTGAIAFLVDGVTSGTRVLDRTRGRLAGYVIPTLGTSSTTNRAPTALATVTCQAGACTFDGTRSSDDAAITGYEWRDPNGTLLSTLAVWSRAYAVGGWQTVVLTVKDAGGLVGSQSVTYNTNVWPATVDNLPVPVATVQCTTGGKCTLDGRGSFDPDGKIEAYRWTGSNGATLSTEALVSSLSVKRGGKLSVTLQVTDNHGFTAQKTVQVAVPK